MRCFRAVCVVLPALFVAANVLLAGERGEEKKGSGAADVRLLPKVPSRVAILKGLETGDPDKEGDKIGEWVMGLIAAKEKRANTELEAIKKRLRSEESARQAAERDRQRRADKYDETWGALGTKTSSGGSGGATHIKLDFQVPEIETYRVAMAVCRVREALANDVVETLPRLDRNGDGRLTENEYRDAGAILTATSRLFQKLDANDDGILNEAEIEAARELPRNATAAIRTGRPTAESAGFKIKPYDADSDGVLDVNERKALTMAYVDVALRAGQEAAFYQRVIEALATAREVVAGKFADIEVTP